MDTDKSERIYQVGDDHPMVAQSIRALIVLSGEPFVERPVALGSLKSLIMPPPL